MVENYPCFSCGRIGKVKSNILDVECEHCNTQERNIKKTREITPRCPSCAEHQDWNSTANELSCPTCMVIYAERLEEEQKLIHDAMVLIRNRDKIKT